MVNEIDRSNTDALGSIWCRLRDLLDAHAEAEERHFYPKLLSVGQGGNDAPSAKEETKDAIGDHNDIRDAGEAVDNHPVGSAEWIAAVGKADVTNSKHMSEEERQALVDFRRHTTLKERHDLGVRFAAFQADHLSGVRPVDKDPDRYVAEHTES